MTDSEKRYIGLDVHKHYLIALGVDADLNIGRGGVGDDHQHLATL